MNTREEVTKTFKTFPPQEKKHYLYWKTNFKFQLKKLYNDYRETTGDNETSFELFSKFYYLSNPEDVQHTLN